MNAKKIFLIVTWNKYPEEDAGAVRQHAFAKNLKDIGYRPVVIGMGKTTGLQKKVFDDIEYYSLRFKGTNILIRALGRALFHINMKRVFHNYTAKDIAGLLIVSGDKNTFRCAEKYATVNRIPLYHDSVEWYSECEFSRGTKDPAYIHNNNINTKYIDDKYKVFAISNYLESYFIGKNIKTVRIPVIMEMKDFQFNKIKEDSTVRFLYAGSMGGKDKIKEFIKGIEILNSEEQAKIEFTVLGITYEQYRAVYGSIDSVLLDRTVIFKGRVPRNNVIDYLNKSDFTVLLRPANERYAKAGFPTKVVESLAMSTPVMCNLTSDLGMYLVDEINSIIVKEPSVEECRDAIRRICCLDPIMLRQMKVAARQTAIDFFDRSNYLDEFKFLLDESK